MIKKNIKKRDSRRLIDEETDGVNIRILKNMRNRHNEKKMIRALRTKNVDELMNIED